MKRANLTIEELARLVRGQTSDDPRPNKAIVPSTIDLVYRDYVHHDLLMSMCLDGFSAPFDVSAPVKSMVDEDQRVNHKSANDYPEAVLQYLIDGQESGALLILDDALMPLWRDDPSVSFHCSPLGVVAKKGADIATKGRVITDMSWPHGASVNDHTMASGLPDVVWSRASTFGKRIVDLAVQSGWSPLQPERSEIYAMAGDVSSAFRNLRATAESVKWFGIHVPQLNVVAFDTAGPFGWKGSPAFYAVGGNGISWAMARESPKSLNPMASDDDEPFFSFEYVDDHLCAELLRGMRLQFAECTLRLLMMATFGPYSINEKKFISWTQHLHALGLDWDLQRCTVSMPREKIDKAKARVQVLLDSKFVTKLQLQQVLGSLRHVCTCNPSAKAFLQRIQRYCNSMSSRHRSPNTVDMRADALFFLDVFEHGRLEGVSLELFADIQTPDLHLYMDASDEGLVVLDPSSRRYMQVRFDSLEREMILRSRVMNLCNVKDLKGRDDVFSINVREFMSVVLAISIWGADWADAERPIHVRVWLDNSAAVKWTNALSSPNSLGQQLCRTLGLSMAKFGLHISAQHLAGSQNNMADAGSREWNSVERRATWSSLSETWLPWHVPSHLRKPYSQQLYEFAMHLHGGPHPIRASTIRSKIGTISWYHKCCYGRTVGLHAGHAIALAGVERDEPPLAVRDPATVDLLWALRSRLDRENAKDRSIWGTTVLGYFFCMRCSEYAATASKTAHHVRVRDVSFQGLDGVRPRRLKDVKSVTIFFRSSKTDQRAAGSSRTLYKSGCKWLCPVGAAWHLFSDSKVLDLAPTAAFCCFRQRDGIVRQVSSDMIRKALKATATSMGMDGTRYAPHSLRIGGATALFLGGASELAIKELGRWKSDAYMRYTRVDVQQHASLAARMVATLNPAHFPNSALGHGSLLH